jgi:hypothetical protein
VLGDWVSYRCLLRKAEGDLCGVMELHNKDKLLLTAEGNMWDEHPSVLYWIKEHLTNLEKIVGNSEGIYEDKVLFWDIVEAWTTLSCAEDYKAALGEIII